MSDTIAAVATPFGPGAIAVLRLGGAEAFEVLRRALGQGAPVEWPERKARRTVIRERDGEVLDEVLVTPFHKPRSYTGEDLIEIGCHGGILVTQRVLGRLLECGARAAEAGEFTQRAFLNGKMDLTQAEAVMDIIAARTGLALKAARHQLDGRLGEAAEALRGELLGVVAHLEAYIDFPEEDTDPGAMADLSRRLAGCGMRIDRLLATAEQGRILREGVRTVICGEPNVGKSSLLNLLLGSERAIVSEIPGTTRDTVEEVVNIGGVPVRLIDTAGMRESHDELERHGVARTRRHLAEAGLILEVADVSKPPGRLLSRAERENRHWILVLNKADLGEHRGWEGVAGVRLSCRERAGLSELTAAIRDELAFGEGDWGQEAVAVNARHQNCLRRAREGVEAGRRQLEGGASPEFAAVDLRLALEAVGEIAGRVETEELLGEIFGRFCIGK